MPVISVQIVDNHCLKVSIRHDLFFRLLAGLLYVRGLIVINADKPYRWNEDTRLSVMQYNDWFLRFAPAAYQGARGECLDQIDELFESSDNLRFLNTDLLASKPSRLTSLRMLCAPPIAVDRLAGLANVNRTQVKRMEDGMLPTRGCKDFVSSKIPALLHVINRLLDRQLLPWLVAEIEPETIDVIVAKSVAADRLCGTSTNPVIRNAQEKRQLKVITEYLDAKHYSFMNDASISAFDMPRGTYAFHKTVRMFRNALDDTDGYVNTPIDVVIMPFDGYSNRPILIECKSAGDFANTNKRRKEEDTKITQLRATYGDDMYLYLFLCGYFDSTYLGYEAANHMDWVWEHRIEDFGALGI